MTDGYNKGIKAALVVKRVASSGKGFLAEHEGEDVWFNIGKGYKGDPFSNLSEGETVHVKYQPKKDEGGGFVIEMDREKDAVKDLGGKAQGGGRNSKEERASIELQGCRRDAVSIVAMHADITPGGWSLDEHVDHVIAQAFRLYRGVHLGKGNEDEQPKDPYGGE